jgi:hypothetical protein
VIADREEVIELPAVFFGMRFGGTRDEQYDGSTATTLGPDDAPHAAAPQPRSCVVH